MSFQPIFKKFLVKADYKPVDLSQSTLNNLNINPQVHDELKNYLDQSKINQKANVLYGGYLERRSLYHKKSLFNTKNKKRNIHLGVDFWANAGEYILAPLSGKVHSYADNTGFGNYGPCIILEHDSAHQKIYTLYGHLSRDSLQGLKKGQLIKQDQVFCKLGTADENGGYLPHLHFQIIKDIEHFKGDYPGVCHQSDLEFYKNNTVNPLTFLEL